MGLRTQLCLSWDDSNWPLGTLEIDHVVDAARVFVTEQNWSTDVLLDLRKSCSFDSLGEPGFNSVTSYGVIELVESISLQYPEVVFYAKGAGEDFGDIWVREFLAGSERRRHGPFEEEVEPLPEELLAQAKAAYATASERTLNKEQTGAKGWLSKFFR